MVGSEADGDSAVQREIEPEVLAGLGSRLSVHLAPQSFRLGDGCRVEIDGCSTHPPVLCEVFAHMGVLLPGQKKKIITDAFKLIYAEKALAIQAHKILALTDDAAAAALRGRAWYAQAFTALGIEVHVVKLSAASEERLRAAQGRQGRAFRARRVA